MKFSRKCPNCKDELSYCNEYVRNKVEREIIESLDCEFLEIRGEI